MSRVLPILFNTEMVRAILDGRKTVTRRVVKYPPHPDMPDNHNYCRMPLWMKIGKDEFGFRMLHYMDVIEQEPFMQTRYFESLAPFDKGDILYVRETWQYLYELDGNEQIIEGTGRYYYAATDMAPFDTYVDSSGITRQKVPWRPSIHMPKEAARIWLKVTDVRVERLQSITDDDCMREGIRAWTKDGRMYKYYPADQEGDCPNCEWSECPRTPKEAMKRIWDSTIPKKQQALYGWSANPWVWVIEFERCGKPEADGT